MMLSHNSPTNPKRELIADRLPTQHSGQGVGARGHWYTRQVDSFQIRSFSQSGYLIAVFSKRAP